jgi:acetyl esterase/lipase
MSDDERHPPIDAELMETVWSSVIEAGRGLTFGLTLDRIPELREVSRPGLVTDDVLRRGRTVDLDERLIPGPPAAPELPALILRPAGHTEPLPCIFYTANGGKVFQSARAGLTHLEPDWVYDIGVVMVSVSPRVGPEDPHPAQVEDAYAGLSWTAEHADDLGIDPDHIVIMGKSGGGGIAAATALMARDRGGPALAHQILIYPMLDDREKTVSSKFEGVIWDRTSNRTGWTAILGEGCGGQNVSQYAAPARATDLGRLPPTYLETGSSEVFRDEIIDYAARLAQAGVPIELHSWAGGYHAFELTAPNAEISRAALAARTSYMRRALRPTRTPRGSA